MKSLGQVAYETWVYRKRILEGPDRKDYEPYESIGPERQKMWAWVANAVETVIRDWPGGGKKWEGTKR